MPKVSVIIPTYNYGEFICDAVDSVLNQTFTDYEIIVIDDGSTDKTKEVVKKYGDKISYHYKNNGGPSSARNLGINLSTGDYVCFLDADDVFLPKKLELQVDLLNQNKKVGLVYSDFLCANNNLRLTTKCYKCKKFSFHSDSFNYLLKTNYINTSTVMAVKNYLFEIGLFNEKYSYLEDYDLWLRMGLNYEFLCVHTPLVKTRSHYKNYRNSVSSIERANCVNEIRKNIKIFLPLKKG